MDASDIIIFIIGGRYGTIDPETGNGYVEDEYDYVLKQGKPYFTICLSDSFIAKKELEYMEKNLALTAKEKEQKEKYDLFKSKVKQIECVEVSDLKEIKGVVMKNINCKIQNYNLPGGWVEYNDNMIIDALNADITFLNEDVKHSLFSNLIAEKFHATEIGGQEITEHFYNIIQQYNQSLKRYLMTMARSIKITLYDEYIEVHNTVNMTYHIDRDESFRFKYNPWMYEGLESDTFEIESFKYNGKIIARKYIKKGKIEYTANPFYIKNVIKVEFPFSQEGETHKIQYSVKYKTDYDRYFHEYVFKEFCQYFMLNASLVDKRKNKC